jgi:hypothetical protein
MLATLIGVLVCFLLTAIMASKRVCAFCPQSAKLTGEHLYAEWIDTLVTTTTRRYDFTDLGPDNRVVRRFSGLHLDRKFKCVCDDCNNGWMSDIDNEARNILKDVILYRAPVCFLASGIKSIARFTLKNAMVADYMYRKPFFSAYQRKQFKESLELSPGTHAWMGGVATGLRVRHGIYKTSYVEPPAHSSLGIQLYVFTWSAECLLFQLVAARWTNLLHHANDGWPKLSHDTQSDKVMVPFWPMPQQRRVTWPPDFQIPHNDLAKIAERFKAVNFY